MKIRKEVYDDHEFSHKETYKVSTLKEDICLSLATSPYKRKNAIKYIEKELPNVSLENTEMLNKISDLVSSLDLDDPRRGKVLPKEYLDMLNQKLEENKNMFLNEDMEK